LVKAENVKRQTYFVVAFEKLADISAAEQAKYAKLMELYRQKPAADDIDKED
jgi:hypothetical protein